MYKPTKATLVLILVGFMSQAAAQDIATDQPVLVPDTSLTFRFGNIDGVATEITPDVVQRFAKQGEIKRPGTTEQLFSLQGFSDFLGKRTGDGRAGTYVAVVVSDQTDLGWYRSVHDYVARMMVGYETARGVSAPGYAEVFGAEVQAVVPLQYAEGAEVSYPGAGKAQIHVGDIIVAVNDSPFGLFNAAEEEKDRYDVRLPNRIVELEVVLEGLLRTDAHRYSYHEYLRNEAAIVAAAKARYGDDIPWSVDAHESLNRSRD